MGRRAVRPRGQMLAAIGVSLAAISIIVTIFTTVYPNRPIVDYSFGLAPAYPKDFLRNEPIISTDFIVRNRGNSDIGIVFTLEANGAHLSYSKNGPFVYTLISTPVTIIPDKNYQINSFYIKPDNGTRSFSVNLSAEKNWKDVLADMKPFYPLTITYEKGEFGWQLKS